jgi:uncharacterized heparinase superfamily protein
VQEGVRLFLRYFHTLKYLKPVQVVYRLLYTVHRQAVPRGKPLELRTCSGVWTTPVAKALSMTGPAAFRFLNREGMVGKPEEWNSGAQEKLWLYNLHYFDYINAMGDEAYRGACRAIMQRWVAENPPVVGNGWEPYPISLRVVNWIKWALAGNELDSRMRESLAMQVRYLSQRLEYHLLANHLFANVKALVFAGLFFQGQEALRWLRRGVKLLERQIREQVLEDGGHFERSAMYHAIVLEDLLDLINMAQAFAGIIEGGLVDAWKQTVEKMFGWLAAMTHPDGKIALFNDAAFGIAAKPEQLREYGTRLGVASGADFRGSVADLRQSGYVRIERGRAALIVDAGAIGPDYQPGHAHADTLSFELSLGDRRVIVDSGASTYAPGAERLRQRSTAAHNTVQVDGRDSSEVWSSFRVAQRARIVERRVVPGVAVDLVVAAHDGYRRMGKGIHRRSFALSDRELVITDELGGKGNAELQAYLHLHPDIVPELLGENTVALKTIDSDEIGVVTVDPKYLVAVEAATWHPEFGMSSANWRIVCSWAGSLPGIVEVRVGWFPGSV